MYWQWGERQRETHTHRDTERDRDRDRQREEKINCLISKCSKLLPNCAKDKTLSKLMIDAQTRICLGEGDALNFLALGYKWNTQFAVLAVQRVKLKESIKLGKILGPC